MAALPNQSLPAILQLDVLVVSRLFRHSTLIHPRQTRQTLTGLAP